MTFPHLQENQDAGSAPEVTERIQFMLAELANAREMFKLSINRFEHLVTLHLAGLTALVSAAAVVLSSEQSLLIKKVCLAVLGSGAYGLSIVIYMRLCIARAMMARKKAQEYRARRYFLLRYADLRRYVEIWPGVLYDVRDVHTAPKRGTSMFAPPTVRMFYAVALVAALLSSASAAAVMSIFFELCGIPSWHRPTLHLGGYLLGAVGPFSGTMLACVLMLRSSRKGVDNYVRFCSEHEPHQEQ